MPTSTALNVALLAEKYAASGIKSQMQYLYSLAIMGPHGNQVTMGLGALQTFAPSETRPMTRLGQIGSDEYYEIVPGRVEDSLTLSRIALIKKNLAEALGYTADMQLLKNQRIPIQITEIMYDPTGGPKAKLYKDCWISDFGKTIDQGTVEIAEDVTIQVTGIEKV